jgi:Tol biopolymer transport system component
VNRSVMFFALGGTLGVFACSDSPTLTADHVEGTLQVPATGAIAFVSNRDGSDHIYVANADGSEATRVTAGSKPSWSWDGARIAFVRGHDIFVMDFDGSNVRHVAAGDNPAWSPDGRIVFNSRINWPADPEGGIFVMNADGSGARLLISHVWAEQFNFAPGYGVDHVSHPTWSPDGRTIAFWLYAGYMGVHSVGVIDVDGSEPRDLQESTTGFRPSTWGRPAWAPDGSRIAVQTADRTWSTVISSYDVATAGWEVAQTPPPWYAENPDWSPDGSRLVFDAEPTPYPDLSGRRIFVISLETGEVRQLIPDALDPVREDYRDSHPVWLRVSR